MEELKKIEKKPASMLVVESFKEAIQTGKFKVGDKIPNESDLSRELGVSRSSLREGMRILAAYGIVEIRQGDGTYVVNKFAEHVFEFMGFLPTKENIKYVTYLRQVLEVGCVALIYDKFNEEECLELRKLVDKISRNDDLSINADAEFHSRMIEKTNNPMICSVYSMMRTMITVLMRTNMAQQEVVETARASHILLCQGFEEKDYTKILDGLKMHYDRIL